jgi:hypothetical protein
MPKFEIDTLQIQFLDNETDDSFIYFMGYDEGDDYTSPETELSDENKNLIKDIRK